MFNDRQDAGGGARKPVVSSDFCAGVAEIAEKMRKRPLRPLNRSPNPRYDKALTNQGFVGTNMAEAMSFILMFIDVY
jgi:hypothetical protein